MSSTATVIYILSFIVQVFVFIRVIKGSRSSKHTGCDML